MKFQNFVNFSCPITIHNYHHDTLFVYLFHMHFNLWRLGYGQVCNMSRNLRCGNYLKRRFSGGYVKRWANVINLILKILSQKFLLAHFWPISGVCRGYKMGTLTRNGLNYVNTWSLSVISWQHLLIAWTSEQISSNF